MPSKQTKTKICTQCDHEGPPDEFVKGKPRCLSCHAQQVQEVRKGKDFELDMPSLAHIKPSTKDFETRDAMSESLKNELAIGLAGAKKLVTFWEGALEKARKAKSGKQMFEAAKGLERAQKQHLDLITRLIEKMEAMEELRAKEERGKPVSFLIGPIPADLPTTAPPVIPNE